VGVVGLGTNIQYTTLCDSYVAQEFVEFLVVPDGELKMTRDDTGLLVVARRVAGQLEDFGCQVLEHSGEVNWRAGADTLRVVALAKETVDTADWERETCLGRTAEAKRIRTCREGWRGGEFLRSERKEKKVNRQVGIGKEPQTSGSSLRPRSCRQTFRQS